VPINEPAWWFPGGGWIAPAACVAWWLGDPAVQFIGGAAVHSLRHDGTQWQALDTSGCALAAASIAVVASAGDSRRLLAPLGFEVSLTAERGQTSGWRDGHPLPLRYPLAGDGYALPLPDGLLCGATSRIDDDEPAPRKEDDALNYERLQRLTGLLPPDRRARALVGDLRLIQDLSPEVDLERDHVRGALDASITVIEFGDFECPYCGQAEAVAQSLLADRDLRFVWRHLPLTDVHPAAELAAGLLRPNRIVLGGHQNQDAAAESGKKIAAFHARPPFAEAARMARTTRGYVPQRQMWPFMPVTISCSAC
jgi:hypothetical protein